MQRRIGFITDRPLNPLVSKALAQLRAEANILSRYDLKETPSFTLATWELIRSVSVLIAYIGRGHNNIFYEIGLAHGAGTPVIIVVEEDVSLPSDLQSQRTIRLGRALKDPQALVFQLKEAMRALDERLAWFVGPSGESAANEPLSSSSNWKAPFSEVLGTAPRNREEHLRRWLYQIVEETPGWQVVAAEAPAPNKRQLFDLVIWNERDDSDLLALGNPIPVEIKSGDSVRPQAMRDVAHQAHVSGLSSLLIVTTTQIDESLSRALVKVGHLVDVRVVPLGSSELMEVDNGESFLLAVKRKLFELQYREEF
jgi:hypothetical protein